MKIQPTEIRQVEIISRDGQTLSKFQDRINAACINIHKNNAQNELNWDPQIQTRMARIDGQDCCIVEYTLYLFSDQDVDYLKQRVSSSY